MILDNIFPWRRPKQAAANKSGLWAGLLEEIDQKLTNANATSKDILHLITKFGCYTFPREDADPLTETIVSDYLAWLDENCTPLSKFPTLIAESKFVHPSLQLKVGDRNISTMFLFHLCIAMRLRPYLPSAPRILEIGGGYGGLARLAKLLWPECSYTIIDLDESLRFSRLFLEENFPQARIQNITKESNSAHSDFDYEMVGANAIEKLHGRSFDIVINTCSFGEMTQSTVDAYHDFFERQIETKFLYSINRFGHRPLGDIDYQAPRDAGMDTSHIPLHPSAQWDVRIWDCWNEGGFAEIELAAAPYLEILLEYAVPENSTMEKLQEKASHLIHAARNLAEGSAEWHYYLFNALRYYPTEVTATRYLRYLQSAKWPEAAFFSRVLKTANSDILLSHNDKPENDMKSILLSKMKFTRLERTHWRRINERIAQMAQKLRAQNGE